MRVRAVLLAASAIACVLPPMVDQAIGASACSSVHPGGGGWTVIDPPAFNGTVSSPIVGEKFVSVDARTIVTSDGGKVLRSADGGCTWQSVYTVGGLPNDVGQGGAYSVQDILVDRLGAQGQKVYLILAPNALVTSGGLTGGPPLLVAVSTDNAATFTLVQPAIPDAAHVSPECSGLLNLAIAEPPSTLYVHCTQSTIRDRVNAVSDQSPYLYRSLDGGATWDTLKLPVGALTGAARNRFADRSFVVSAADPREMWVAGYDQSSGHKVLTVWHSTNAGSAWTSSQPMGTATPNANSVVLVTDVTAKPTLVAAYSGDGAFESADGQHWVTLARRLTDFGSAAAADAFFNHRNLFIELTGGVGCPQLRLTRYAPLNPRGVAAVPTTSSKLMDWAITPPSSTVPAPVLGLASVLTSMTGTGCNEAQKWVTYAPPPDRRGGH